MRILVLIIPYSGFSSSPNPSPVLLIVVPCRQDQSKERQYYRQMINNFSDVAQFKINIVFVAYVSGVEHLKRSTEHDLVIVMDNWKDDYKDIYCKSLTLSWLVCLTLKISTHLIVSSLKTKKQTLFMLNY